MGAKSGYHPISLHVIRGAAEFSGFKIGKLKKIAVFPEQQKAVYACWITEAPPHADDWPPKVYRRQFQHCFMDDIRVTTIRMSTDSETVAILSIQLNKTPMDALLEGDDE